MSWKRKVGGGLLGFIGFMLSPLSWWNDLFVNIPLAVGFAWLVAWIHPPAFNASVVLGYWLTNVLGLFLMHKGGQIAFADRNPQTGWRRALIKNLLVSLAYTALILFLARLKILQPVSDYFRGR